MSEPIVVGMKLEDVMFMHELLAEALQPKVAFDPTSMDGMAQEANEIIIKNIRLVHDELGKVIG